MVFGLIRNKNRCTAMVCAFFLICTILFSGCDPRSGKYPHQRSEQWCSEEPQISLNYSKREDGTWEFNETLLYNGSLKEINLAMHSSYYCVYPADSNHHGDRLFSGSWKYRSGNLVLIVEEDFIFDGKYSKIILKPIEGKTTP